MKKILILTAAFVLTYQFSNAQTEKGTENLGLAFGFSSNNANDFTISPADQSTSTLSTKTNSFNIGPTFGYFVKDKLEIGASLSYSTTNTTNNTENFATTNNSYPAKESTNNFSLSVFARKYFMYHNVIGFRTGAYVGYTNGNQKQTYTQSYTAYNFDGTTNYYSAGANLDLVYYPSKKLGISATIANLEYYHYKTDNGTQGHDAGDNVSFGLINNGLTLSVFYVFGGK